jgi:hypothetical protein
MGFNTRATLCCSAITPWLGREQTPKFPRSGKLNKVGQKICSRWRRLARWTQWTVLTLIVLGVAIRLSLPFVVRHYVNRQLNKIPDYHGHVEKVRMHLYRGAYSIINVEVVKTNGSVAVPFMAMPEMDLSIDWKELFHGSVVGTVTAVQPLVNFVNGPTQTNSQLEVHKDWQQVLSSLLPFNINRFQVEDGDIRFRDPYREPKVDIYVTNLFAIATNLSNSRDLTDRLPAGLIAQGKTIGHGDLNLELHINPMAKNPTFNLQAAVSNMDLTALNDFMRAYGNFDVAQGIFQLYCEVAAADGRFEGYVKPFFQNLQVFDWQKERKKNILKIFWEAIVAGAANVLKNQPHDQLATKIPISGTFEKTNVDIWATIGGILRNAFIRALVPRIDRSIRLEDVEQNRKPPS